MQIHTLPVGVLATNCYLVSEETPAGGIRLYIIDPGGDGEEITAAAESLRPASCAVLLTHAHADHIHALGEVTAALKPDYVYLAPEDLPIYRSPDNALEGCLDAAENLPETTGEIPDGDAKVFQLLHLPGHTPGGSGFLFGNHLFSGDTVFAGSVGRTDLPGGDWQTLLKSIHDVIIPLPDDTMIHPGHGPSTEAGREKTGNPYFNCD